MFQVNHLESSIVFPRPTPSKVCNQKEMILKRKWELKNININRHWIISYGKLTCAYNLREFAKQFEQHVQNIAVLQSIHERSPMPLKVLDSSRSRQLSN